MTQMRRRGRLPTPICQGMLILGNGILGCKYRMSHLEARAPTFRVPPWLKCLASIGITLAPPARTRLSYHRHSRSLKRSTRKEAQDCAPRALSIARRPSLPVPQRHDHRSIQGASGVSRSDYQHRAPCVEATIGRGNRPADCRGSAESKDATRQTSLQHCIRCEPLRSWRNVSTHARHHTPTFFANNAQRRARWKASSPSRDATSEKRHLSCTGSVRRPTTKHVRAPRAFPRFHLHEPAHGFPIFARALRPAPPR